MTEISSKKGILKEKSFALAVRIIKLCHHVRETKREFEMTKQLFKSGTNPGAMVREAEYAQSAGDFINKLEIAQKELNETRYWLELLYVNHFLTDQEFNSIATSVDEVMKLTTSSIKTKKTNLKKLTTNH